MPPSITAKAAWPKPASLAMRLVVAFALAISVSWWLGQPLVKAMLPATRTILGWMDNNFEIQHLGLDRTHQDTVIRLRVNLARWIVVGTTPVEPLAKGWLEVTTTLGAMLQPLVIAAGLAAAWPAPLLRSLGRATLAIVLGCLFMLIDIPITLYGYVWDMFVTRLDPSGFSPLLAVHQFMHAGGRLGAGIVLSLLAIHAADKWWTGITRPGKRSPAI